MGNRAEEEIPGDRLELQGPDILSPGDGGKVTTSPWEVLPGQEAALITQHVWKRENSVPFTYNTSLLSIHMPGSVPSTKRRPG